MIPKVTVTGNSMVFEVTRLVNGGTNGIVDIKSITI